MSEKTQQYNIELKYTETGYAKVFGKLNKALDTAGMKTGQVVQAMAAYETQSGKLRIPIQVLTEEGRKLSGVLEETEKGFKLRVQSLTEATSVLNKAKIAASDFSKSFVASFKDPQDSTLAVQDKLTKLQQFMSRGIMTPETMTGVIDLVKQKGSLALSDLTDQTERQFAQMLVRLESARATAASQLNADPGKSAALIADQQRIRDIVMGMAPGLNKIDKLWDSITRNVVDSGISSDRLNELIRIAHREQQVSLSSLDDKQRSIVLSIRAANEAHNKAIAAIIKENKALAAQQRLRNLATYGEKLKAPVTPAGQAAVSTLLRQLGRTSTSMQEIERLMHAFETTGSDAWKTVTKGNRDAAIAIHNYLDALERVGASDALVKDQQKIRDTFMGMAPGVVKLDKMWARITKNVLDSGISSKQANDLVEIAYGRQQVALSDLNETQRAIVLSIREAALAQKRVTDAVRDQDKITSAEDRKEKRLRDLAAFGSNLGTPNTDAGQAALANLLRSLGKMEVSVSDISRLMDAFRANGENAWQGVTDETREAAVALSAYNKALERANAAQALVSRKAEVLSFLPAPMTPEAHKAVESLADRISRSGMDIQTFKNIFESFQRDGQAAWKGISNETREAAIEVNKYMKAVSDPRGVKAAQAMTLSWRSFVRLMQVQFASMIAGGAVRGLQTITQAALDFELKAREVQTIQGTATRSTRLWRKELTKLSDTFGLDVIDVGTAAYTALSNQVVGAAGSTRFLSDALMFARTTVSSAEDAVNLLSSAINAYHMSSMQAEQISAQMFKTMELGRLRISDIANDYGVSAAMAAQTSVSMQEMNAVLVTLTRQGVQASVAQTLLNNILLMMIKPTQEMRNMLAELGYESGEAALQTEGFIGVMRRLEDEYNRGGAQRLGELGGRIRAIRGMGATISDIERFSEAMFHLGASGTNLEEITANVEHVFTEYRKTQSLMEESSAVAVKRIKANIDNILREGLGEAVVQTLLYLDKLIGGTGKNVKRITEMMMVAASSVKPLVVTIAYLGSGILYASKALGVLLSAGSGAMVSMAVWSVVVNGWSSAIGVLTLRIWGNIAALQAWQRTAALAGGAIGAAIALVSIATVAYAETAEQAYDRAAEAVRKHYEVGEEAYAEAKKKELAIEEQMATVRIRAIRQYYHSLILESNKAAEKMLKKAAEFDFVQSDVLRAIIGVDSYKDSDDVLQAAKASLKEINEQIKEITLAKALDQITLLTPIADILQLPDALEGLNKAKSVAESMFDKAKSQLDDIRKTLKGINDTKDSRIFQASLGGKSERQQDRMLRERLESLKALAANATSLEEARRLSSEIMSLTEQTNNLYEKRRRGRSDISLIEDAFNTQATIEKKFEGVIANEVNDAQVELSVFATRSLMFLQDQQTALEKATLEKVSQLRLTEETVTAQEKLNRLYEELSGKAQAARNKEVTSRNEFDAARQDLAGQAEAAKSKFFFGPVYKGSNRDLAGGLQLRKVVNDIKSVMFDTNVTEQQRVDIIQQQLDILKTLEFSTKAAKDAQQSLNMSAQSYIDKYKILAEDTSTLDNIVSQVSESEKLARAYGIQLQYKESERRETERILEVIKETFNILDNAKRGTHVPNMGAKPGAANGFTGMDDRSIQIGRGEMVMNRMATRALLPQLISANAGFQNTGGVGGSITTGDFNFNVGSVPPNPQEFAAEVWSYIKRGINSGKMKA